MIRFSRSHQESFCLSLLLIEYPPKPTHRLKKDNTAMSITYSVAASIVRLLNIKKLFRKSETEILSFATKQIKKFKLPLGQFKGYHYSIEEIDGFKCLRLQAALKPTTKAVLQLYGGGYVTPPDARDFKLAKRIVDQTGSDVWFFLYPLIVDQTLDVTFEKTNRLYQHMLEQYDPEQISILGFSSGACLAIGLGQYNNEQPRRLPSPRQIIAVSPGGIPLSLCDEHQVVSGEDADFIASLRALSAQDVIIDYHYFDTVASMLNRTKRLPDYMINSCVGDFSHFPKTYLYYGSHECLYACAPYYERAFVQYGVPYEIHVGEGLCHCYPLFRFFPEGRKAQDEIINLLR